MFGFILSMHMETENLSTRGNFVSFILSCSAGVVHQTINSFRLFTICLPKWRSHIGTCTTKRPPGTDVNSIHKPCFWIHTIEVRNYVKMHKRTTAMTLNYVNKQSQWYWTALPYVRTDKRLQYYVLADGNQGNHSKKSIKFYFLRHACSCIHHRINLTILRNSRNY